MENKDEEAPKTKEMEEDDLGRDKGKVEDDVLLDLESIIEIGQEPKGVVGGEEEGLGDDDRSFLKYSNCSSKYMCMASSISD